MRNFFFVLMLVIAGTITAQVTHTIDFEPAGTGADWSWSMVENADNPPLEFIANPVSGGINTTPSVAKFTVRQYGQPWALCFTDGDGAFVFDQSNKLVKIMIYKSKISNVGMKFEGMSGGVEIQVANTLINQWEEITFDFSGSVGNSYSRIVIIPDFDFNPRPGDNVIYFDNIQVPDGFIAPPLAEPTTVPPVPGHAPENVLSIYTEVYPNLAGTNFNPNWGQSTTVTVDFLAAGNNTLKYANLNYQGTQFSNQNVSGYEYIHLDFWTPNSTSLKFYLISPGAETSYTLPITQETWVSVDIPLSHFVPPVNLSDVFQFKVDGNGTVYFDNWYFWKNPSTSTTVTFKVDMSQYGNSFGNVYVSGSFNGWSGDANQLLDPEMDDIYETTLELADGSYEYKFTLDNWSVQEQFQGGEPCTVTNGGYTNRALEVTGSMVLPAVCWNSCETCTFIPPDVTFNVDMNQYLNAFGNVYVSGTMNGWCGNCNLMTDPDLDGIYSITLPLAEGAYEYKFTIDNWAVQENFVGGEPCTVTNWGFTNRFLQVTESVVLPEVCWNSCDPCGEPPAIYDVTFKVDMNQYQGGYSIVTLNGTFNGWCGSCNILTDDDMDGVFEITLPLLEGSYQYKFTLNGWDIWEEFAGGEPCTVTLGGFTNRSLEVVDNTVLPAVCWNSCDECPTYPAGWNGISSNVNPVAKISMEELFAPILDDMIILLGKNGLFWPGQNINTIGNWDTYQGYKVKFSAGVDFQFEGTPLENRTVALSAGTSLLPVLSEEPASLEDVILPLGNNINFMFDISTGEVYWPAGGIVPGVNGALTTMYPGFAYLINVKNATIVDFGLVPPKSAPAKRFNHANPFVPSWNAVNKTGEQHIISVSGMAVLPNDIVGVFDNQGLCCGISANNEGAVMPLVIYGDDITTAAKDGLIQGEMMTFRIFRDGKETEVVPVFNQSFADRNGLFAKDGLSVISEFKEGTTGINYGETIAFTIFPNPNNGRFTINTDVSDACTFSVTNMHGQLVYSSKISGSLQLDLSNQPKGVYMVRISNSVTTAIKKVVVE